MKTKTEIQFLLSIIKVDDDFIIFFKNNCNGTIEAIIDKQEITTNCTSVFL